jgi:hypothetical protein
MDRYNEVVNLFLNKYINWAIVPHINNGGMSMMFPLYNYYRLSIRDALRTSSRYKPLLIGCAADKGGRPVSLGWRQRLVFLRAVQSRSQTWQESAFSLSTVSPACPAGNLNVKTCTQTKCIQNISVRFQEKLLLELTIYFSCFFSFWLWAYSSIALNYFRRFLESGPQTGITVLIVNSLQNITDDLIPI